MGNFNDGAALCVVCECVLNVHDVLSFGNKCEACLGVVYRPDDAVDTGLCVHCDVGLTEIEKMLFDGSCRVCMDVEHEALGVNEVVSKPIIYIASPYTHESSAVMERRFKQVEAFTAELLRGGTVAFSPIVHCHQLGLNYSLPTDFAFWQEYCFSMLATADVVWVLQLDGWRESVGVQAEIMFAYERGLVVSHEVDVARFTEGYS